MFANCEHFVTEVRTGRAVSLQVETVGQWATNIVETVGQWATNIVKIVGEWAIIIAATVVGIFAMAAIRVFGATRSNQKESPGGDCWTVGNYVLTYLQW